MRERKNEKVYIIARGINNLSGVFFFLYITTILDLLEKKSQKLICRGDYETD